MAWRRHSYPKRRKKVPGDPYRSDLERRLARTLVNCRYEHRKVKYVTESTYNPDFDFPDKDWLLIEAKGRFINGTSEARKYVKVAQQHKGTEVVFILERAMTKAYTAAKRRKDGSVLTMGEWCAKNKFLFFEEKKIPQWFIEGDFDRDFIKNEKRNQRQEWLGK